MNDIKFIEDIKDKSVIKYGLFAITTGTVNVQISSTEFK